MSNLVVFVDAEEKFGKRGNKILMADGSQVEDLNALRENDHLYIFWELFKYMGKYHPENELLWHVKNMRCVM